MESTIDDQQEVIHDVWPNIVGQSAEMQTDNKYRSLLIQQMGR